MNINKETIKDEIIKTKNNASALAVKAKNTAVVSKKKIMNTIDVNGDGEVNLDDVLIMALKTPGVRIDRKSFLEKELSNKFSKEVVDLAIDKSPSDAGITVDELNPIVNNIIQLERTRVSGISAALSAPGGIAMVATLPADLAQYYGYMLRVAQELMYLYSFPEIDVKEKDCMFDSATLNMLTLCLGVMYGVAGANATIKALASGLASGVSKKIMTTALTKGTIYPIIKKISQWFGKTITKSVLAGAAKKAIPVVGGVIGGGLTYFTFKPCCDKLKNSLKDTLLSNPNHKVSKEETIILAEIEK